MRILKDDEMDAVAGGQGHTIGVMADVAVKVKDKSKPIGVNHPLEQELPGDGGDNGGGGGGGGGGDDGGGNDVGIGNDGGGGDLGDDLDGDYGDDVGGDNDGGGNTSGDDTGDTGGDDGYGNDLPDTGAPVDEVQNDVELAKAEDNPKADIKLSCNSENGSKTCVAGNAEHFIVTTTDKNGNTTAYSCGLNPGYSVALSLELFKSIRGGSAGVEWTQSPSFDCKILPKHG